MRRQIAVAHAPTPQGAYSQAIMASGPFLFVSGQGPLDPETARPVAGDFEEQARRAFGNVQAIAEGAGGSLDGAVKVNVYLRDIGDFAAMNRIYQEFFHDPLPARTTVQAMLADADIEVDAIVAFSETRE